MYQDRALEIRNGRSPRLYARIAALKAVFVMSMTVRLSLVEDGHCCVNSLWNSPMHLAASEPDPVAPHPPHLTDRARGKPQAKHYSIPAE